MLRRNLTDEELLVPDETPEPDVLTGAAEPVAVEEPALEALLPAEAAPVDGVDAIVDELAAQGLPEAPPEAPEFDAFAQKMRDIKFKQELAQEQAQKAERGKLGAQIADAALAGNNLSRLLMHQSEMDDVGGDIMKNAMANVAAAENQQKALAGQALGLEQSHDNGLKQKAMAAAAAERAQMLETGVNDRFNKKLAFDAEQKEAGRQNALDKAKIMASRKRGGSGGGAAGPDLRQDAEWLEAATRGDANAKKELLAMNRKDFGTWLKGHASRGDQAPSKEEQSQLKLQQSQEKTDKGTAQKIGDWRSKARIDDDYKLINEATAQIEANKDLFKDYFALGGIKKGWENVKAYMGDEKAKKAQEAFNLLQKTVENYARDRSGAAIGVKEWETFKEQLGTGKFSSPEAALAGLRRLMETIKSKDNSFLAGKGGGARLYAKEAVSRGITTPWLVEEASKEDSETSPKASAPAVSDTVIVELNGVRKPVPRKNAEGLVKNHGATIVQ